MCRVWKQVAQRLAMLRAWEWNGKPWSTLSQREIKPTIQPGYAAQFKACEAVCIG